MDTIYSANLIITAANPIITGNRIIKATVPNAAITARTNAAHDIEAITASIAVPATTARAINAAAPNTSAKVNAACAAAAGSVAIAANASAYLIIIVAKPIITGNRTIKATVPAAATTANANPITANTPNTASAADAIMTSVAIKAAAPKITANCNAVIAAVFISKPIDNKPIAIPIIAAANNTITNVMANIATAPNAIIGAAANISGAAVPRASNAADAIKTSTAIKPAAPIIAAIVSANTIASAGLIPAKPKIFFAANINTAIKATTPTTNIAIAAAPLSIFKPADFILPQLNSGILNALPAAFSPAPKAFSPRAPTAFFPAPATTASPLCITVCSTLEATVDSAAVTALFSIPAPV